MLFRSKNKKLKTSHQTTKPSLAQHAHGVLESLEGERKHAVADQLLDDADALSVLPDTHWLGVDPSETGVGMGQALDPFSAGFFVVVFDAATRLQDFIRAHGGIAHEHQFMVFVEFANHIPSVKFFCKAAAIVLP